MIGSIPSGNLRLSCGILFAGALASKGLRVFQFMNMRSISTDTFMKHQRHYLPPAVMEVWENLRGKYIDDALQNGRSLCIGGDGRCDTPGHSAKFGSYSVMDLDNGTMIDIQLVESNEVKSSCHMEKEGLARSVAYLQSQGINIYKIVTDRHVQIIKWVSENMTETQHYVDVWHVAKGLQKKMLALSKEKECGVIQNWIRSVTNHLYWTAASTPDGNGTKPLEKLITLLNSRQMKKDIPKLSTLQQTSELEGYHSVVNQFAPKMDGFSYNGMMCR
ncbi:uncharacterized protein LOC144350407 [Saccoglossus kowalevskii]